MKKLFLVSTLFVLGCGNPLGVNKSSIEDLTKDSPSASLIKADVSVIGGEEPPVVAPEPVGPEAIKIIQESVPPSVQEPVEQAVAQVENTELPALPHELPVETPKATEEVKKETSPVSQVIYEALETVSEHSEEVLTSEVVPDTKSQVAETVQNVPAQVSEVAQNTLEQASQPTSATPEESLSQLGLDPVVEQIKENVEASSDPASLVDSDMKAELDKVTYSEDSSDLTMVTYKKEKGKAEAYSIYSQIPKDSGWNKEFSVLVEDGKVKTILSHNNKKIESFSEELQEIISLEKKFKEKLSSKDTDESKEVTVSQFVKNKKDKKTSKIKNKKFGKRSKKRR